MEVAYAEDTQDAGLNLTRLRISNDGHMDDVHAAREQYRADQVTLLSVQHDVGGMGYLLNDPNGAPDWAFAVVRIQQADGHTFAHELGHNMGAHHRKDQVSPGPGLYSYSAGWRWLGTNGTRYCSVMSYSEDWNGQPVYPVLHFSDPAISHQGQPTGHAADGNNARSLREIKTVFADYRDAASRIIRISGNGDFGSVPVGQNAQRILAIHNDGTDPLAVGEIAYPAGFSGAWSGTIPAGHSQSLAVAFQPPYPGAYSGSLDVRSDMTFGTHLFPLSGTGLEVPHLFLSITSPPARTTTVAHAVADVSLQGTVGTSVVGHVRWTNALAAAGGSAALAGTNFALAAAPLAVGTNLLSVSGTNSPAPGGTLAQDHAGNAPYGDGWQTGENGGSGFGPWTLVATGNAGHWRATQSANPNLAVAPTAWGLWANGTGLAEAIRPLANPLRPGATLRLKFENGWVENDSSVGFALRNAAGAFTAEFMFAGGDSHYRLNDAFENRPSHVAWTEDGLDLAIDLTSPSTYRLRSGGGASIGHLRPRADMQIRQLRVWNYSAGPGDNYNLYLADLAVTNDFVALQTLSDSVVLVRQPALHALVYRAGAGGSIVGLATQLVAHGGSGSPVAASPDDPTVLFAGWSDGILDNPRTDSGVAADISVWSRHRSAGGADLDWYALHGHTPQAGETWSDLDARPAPG